MGRPSRKLPFSRADGRSPNFLLTDENWNEVELAYGCALSDTIRQSIVDATNQFLASEVFERNAKPSRPTIDMVESIRAMSDKIRKKLSAGGETAAFAQSAIMEHLVSKYLKLEPYEQLFHALDEVTSSLSAACTQALTELDDPEAHVFRDGVSWDRWIRVLTHIAEQNGLPIAASNAGNAEAELGPFARFVEALQELFPQEVRRHANTRLSSAIYRARRQPIEEIEESE
jgi:hypothetical protein